MNSMKNTPRNKLENSLNFNQIYEMYKSEFMICCENILTEQKNKLLSSFFYKMKLIIKYNYNKDSFINEKPLTEIIKKCELNFISDIYNPMYNICSSSLNRLISSKLLSEKPLSKNGGITNQYLNNFLPHCLNEKTALHTCGKKFIQIINNNLNYAICILCKKCYFGDLIYMYCPNCNKNYFSEIIKNNNLINDEYLYPATWEKYHCNIVMNEQMSCIQCKEKFWLKKNKLFCKECKLEINPLDIFWTCIVCQKDFKSNVKIYNPLEYKIIKLKVRDAILYKKIVKPTHLPCKCIKEEDVDKIDFYHKLKNECCGVMYYTQLGNIHSVVCSSCSLICPINEFKWCCPICKNYFLAYCTKIYDNNHKFEKLINIDNIFEGEYKRDFHFKKNFKKIENGLKNSKNIKNSINNDDESNNNLTDLFFNSINNGSNTNSIINNINSGLNSNSNTLTSRNKNAIKFIKKKINMFNNTLTKKDYRKVHKKNNISYCKCSSINFFNINKTKNSNQSSIDKCKKKIFGKTNIFKNNLNTRNSNISYSNRFNTFNDSLIEKKRHVKGLTIVFNKSNNKSIFKLDNDEIINNKYKNYNLSANKTRIIKNNKNDKRKEEIKIRANNNDKNKIPIISLNLTNNLFKNDHKLLNRFKKMGNYKVSKILTGGNSIIKYNEFKKNNSRDKKIMKNNSKRYKITINIDSSKKKNRSIKRELSLPQTKKNNTFIRQKNISNIKYKINYTSEPTFKKNNYKLINSNNKKYFFYKIDNRQETNYNRSLSHIKNLNGDNYSSKCNNYVSSHKNVPRNKKFKKDNNITPIQSEKFNQPLKNKNNNISIHLFSNINKSENHLKVFMKNKIIKKPNGSIHNKNIQSRIINNKNNLIKKINSKKIIKSKEKERTIKKEINLIPLLDNNINDNKNSDNNNISNGLKDYNENDIKQFNFDEYKIITQLGHGTFSKIYLVQDKNKNLFSMKKIILSDEIDVDSVIKEYKMCSTYKHENIVNLLGLYSSKLDKTTYVVYILMELGKTDWEKEIRHNFEKKIEYSEKELINIVKQLTSALSFMQTKNIVHRDIKPQNIIIFKNNIYKLADFGESKQIHNISYSLINGTLRGTELYMSPLLFNGLRNGQIDVKHNLFKSDVYSLGLCILFAATSTNKSLYDIRNFVDMEGLREYIENILENKYSKKLINLIISMLEIHEEKRPDFIELENIISRTF